MNYEDSVINVLHFIPNCLTLAWDMFFSDNEESDNEKVEMIKVQGFSLSALLEFPDKQFQYHFRLTRSCFDHLLTLLNHAETRNIIPGRLEIKMYKQLMLTIWYIANMESIRSVANRFGVAKSIAWKYIFRTCQKIIKVNVEQKIITWTSSAQKRMDKEKFFQISNFPGVIGAIDGCHIKIDAPHYSPSSYINRKGYHSILLQGICNPYMKFLDIYVGEAGSIHDACMLKRSDIFRRINENLVEIPEDEHLLGDSAYPLLDFLMVPFKNYGNLGDPQKRFNQSLSKCRVRIEQAFGLLKCKFRRLKYLETKRLDIAVQIILTACVLHNLCLDDSDVDSYDLSNKSLELTPRSNELQSSSAQRKRESLLFNFN